MPKLAVVTVTALLLGANWGVMAAEAACGPKKIIIETDFYAFSDELSPPLLPPPNAIGMANAFMSWGEVDIIGIVSSIHSEYAPPAIDAFNTFYGHGDIPIAIKKPLNDSTGDWEYSNYPDYVIPLVEHFSEAIHTGWNTTDPVPLYRKLLSESADSSVTIAMIGFLDNIYDLLMSGPDALSPLSGLELAKQKVVELVLQADPTAPSYNLDHVNGTYAEYVLSVWPNTITFVPGSIGSDTHCCAKLTTDLDVSTDPVAFTWNISVGYNKTYKSWDPTAMLYVGRGLGDWYIYNQTTEQGYAVEANATGDTYLDTSKKSPAPQQAVEIAPTFSNVSLADLIQDILLWTPGEPWPADAGLKCSSNSSSSSSLPTGTSSATATTVASTGVASPSAYTGGAVELGASQLGLLACGAAILAMFAVQL
ncbi:hypothetical protein PV08_06106 [Exophiala spinifera]|uniref:Inosine/uridine-preferring nucleoside hydrolase domain-containing protein n=1 Tax=Exophiala spinifera TaxID=91928 RepID=A0A0D2BBT0_9EURO|nr:uncharacterized protein PV08_06106 [Exophiala spinifera]KIW16055.1 hypothetical protein PV08_06106 [Exophiala spinifera]